MSSLPTAWSTRCPLMRTSTVVLHGPPPVGEPWWRRAGEERLLLLVVGNAERDIGAEVPSPLDDLERRRRTATIAARAWSSGDAGSARPLPSA